jgi:hypothetical protein
MIAHKTLFKLTLRNRETGEEHTRTIFAIDEATAGERAVIRARLALGTTMAERNYGQLFDVLTVEKVEG